VCGTNIQTVAASSAGGYECHLSQSTRRPKVSLRNNTTFGAFRYFLDKPSERGTKKMSAIALSAHQGGERALKGHPQPIRSPS
jgi:hypothetical protein